MSVLVEVEADVLFLAYLQHYIIPQNCIKSAIIFIRQTSDHPGGIFLHHLPGQLKTATEGGTRTQNPAHLNRGTKNAPTQ